MSNALGIPRTERGIVHALLNLRDGELRPVVSAGVFFFCVLAALMALRPARDALGMEHGVANVRLLIVGTAAATLALNPVFGWLVSRSKRLQLISVTYGFLVASLVGFWAVMTLASAPIARLGSQVFYVWFNVFNLFATTVFWSAMSDCFTREQSERLFGSISIGGTLGAIFGPWLTSQVAGRVGATGVLPIAAGLILVGVSAAWSLLRTSPEPVEHRVGTARIGGSAWGGIRSVFRSSYLSGVAAYVLLAAVMVTIVYLTRLQMVATVAGDVNARAAVLGNVDMWTHVGVLALQLVFAGRIIKRFGLGLSLALLPIVTALGFVGLAIYGSFAALVVLEVATRAVQRGVTQPAREALFTVVEREDKYKAKALIDTFVYRAGDVVGAQTEGALGSLGAATSGVAAAVLPLAFLWMVLAVWLGRARRVR